MRSLRPILIVIIVATVLLLPAAPGLIDVPHRDAGVFLYVGERILSGGVPYRDVWDHKPPVIFFVNALGLLLGGGTPWGVWLLEIVALGAAVLFGYRALGLVFGGAAAAVATVGWLAGFVTLIYGLPALRGANWTEEWALPLQFAGLYLFARALTDPARRGRFGLISGVLLGLTFFLRQNLIALWAAQVVVIGVSVVARRRLDRWDLFVLNLLVGVLAVVVVIVLYFVLTGALDAFWDSAFVFNFAYSSTTGSQRLNSLLGGLRLTGEAGLMQLALIGGLLGGLRLLLTRRVPALLGVGLVALPLELLAASLSGRLYPHYFLAWLPVFAVLVAALAAPLIASVRAWLHPSGTTESPGRLATGLTVIALALPLTLLPALDYVNQLATGLEIDSRRTCPDVIADIIQRDTDPSDSVLVWGAEVSLHIVTDRRAPTRYVYQLPLVSAGYQNRDRIAELLGDLVADPPALIIDTARTNPAIPSLDAAERAGWPFPTTNPAILAETANLTLPPEMASVFDYIAANYTPTDPCGIARSWLVYEWRAAPNPNNELNEP